MENRIIKYKNFDIKVYKESVYSHCSYNPVYQERTSYFIDNHRFYDILSVERYIDNNLTHEGKIKQMEIRKLQAKIDKLESEKYRLKMN